MEKQNVANMHHQWFLPDGHATTMKLETLIVVDQIRYASAFKARHLAVNGAIVTLHIDRSIIAAIVDGDDAPGRALAHLRSMAHTVPDIGIVRHALENTCSLEYTSCHHPSLYGAWRQASAPQSVFYLSHLEHSDARRATSAALVGELRRSSHTTERTHRPLPSYMRWQT